MGFQRRERGGRMLWQMEDLIPTMKLAFVDKVLVSSRVVSRGYETYDQGYV